MKRRLFHLTIGIDLHTVGSRKTTKDAYRYINRIPCKQCACSHQSDAEYYIDEEMSQY